MGDPGYEMVRIDVNSLSEKGRNALYNQASLAIRDLVVDGEVVRTATVERFWANGYKATIVEETSGPALGLTTDEEKAIALAADLTNLLAKIVGRGPSRDGDMAELVGHIHGIQHAVMAQAAARAHPDLYRLLGETL